MPQPSAAVGHCTVGAMQSPRGRDASAHADEPFTNPHLHQDWAHPGQQLLWCAGTGLIPATSAPGPAHPGHICVGTGCTAATSAPGPGADARVVCAEPEHVVACEHGPRRRRPPGLALDASRKPPFIRTPSIAELASAAHFPASPLVALNSGRLRRAAQSWTRPLQRPSCSAASRMALAAPRPRVTPAARM